MNIWFRRLLLILTIGGGFVGVTVTVMAPLATRHTTMFYVFATLAVILYGYGIFVGFRVADGSIPYAHLFLYNALQVPFVSSPFLSYRFTSGFDITLQAVGMAVGAAFNIGSDWRLTVQEPSPWGAGVNVFALLVILLLYVHRFYKSEDAAVPAEPLTESQPKQTLYDYCVPQRR